LTAAYMFASAFGIFAVACSSADSTTGSGKDTESGPAKDTTTQTPTEGSQTTDQPATPTVPVLGEPDGGTAAEPTVALFPQVKAIVQEKCVACHSASSASGGTNLATDSSIAAKSSRVSIRVAAGTMPPSGSLPLSDSDKKIIADWAARGGKVTD